MSFVVVHLSDIHVSTDKPNPVFARSAGIAAAVQSMCVLSRDVVFLVTGDVAFSGQRKEYDKAIGFLRQIQSELLRLNSELLVHWAVVPGNHDCDLSGAQGNRESILEHQKRLAAPHGDAQRLKALLEPQAQFRQFVSVITSESPPIDSPYSIKIVGLAGTNLCICAYNTAICSTNPEEQGDLLFPVEVIQPLDGKTDVVISIFHHPYKWFESVNGREFQKHIEMRSDLILTGHEHELGTFDLRNHLADSNVTYVEGGVLQDSNRPTESAFNIFIVDAENKKIRHHQFVWNGEIYENKQLGADWEQFQRNRNRLRSEFEIATSFYARFLTDPGAGFTHPTKKLELDDIYVNGNLEEIERVGESELVLPPISMAAFIEKTAEESKVLIVGEEQAGKTSFAKYLFKRYHEAGLVPVLLKASLLTRKHTDEVGFLKLLHSEFADQYSSQLVQKFSQLSPDKRVVIIDDIHLVGFGQKELAAIVDLAASQFAKVIVFSHKLSVFEEVASASGDRNPFLEFVQFEIKEFGNQLRETLIEKWITAGHTYGFDEQSLEKDVVKTKKVVDELLGRNLLPSYPIFILIILQQLEASTNLATANGAHGYLYESLITNSLVNAETKLDLDTAYTFLSLLAERMFVKKVRSLSEYEFGDVHREFCNFSRQEIRLERIEKPLLQAKIILQHNGKYWFRYKYCYFYFAARYLSDRLGQENTNHRLKTLTSEVYREEAANILIFLAYLSNKDRSLIDLMLTHSRALYAEKQPCDFRTHTEFVDKIHQELPRRVLIDRASKTSRAELNERMDSIGVQKRTNGEDEAEFEDLLKINTALKTIQILGQLLKNFPSSLDGELKKEIAMECYRLGLTTITMFVDFASDNQSALEKLFDEWMNKGQAGDAAERTKRAKQFLAMLVEGFASHVIKRVSGSVGVKTLLPIYEQIKKENPGVPIGIIDYSIKLDHFESFPSKELNTLIEEGKKNIFPILILRRLTIDHFYRFPVKLADKQFACEKLKIELKRITLLENKGKRS